MKENLRKYTRKNLKQSSFKIFFSRLSITGWLILINIIFFIIIYILMLAYFPNTTEIVDGESVPSLNQFIEDNIALNVNNILEFRIWTLLTSMFMHGGFLHLFINMFVLLSLGSFCEKIIGRKRFFWFYMISGIFAGLLFVLLAGFFGQTELGARIFGSPDVSGVGASGAIFAIAGLFMILTPRLKFTIIFFPFFSFPAYIIIPLVLFGVWIVSAMAGGGFIGNTAHFGGFLAGAFYGIYLRKKYPRKVRMLNNYVGEF